MQRVCRVPGGIKAYLESPGCLVTSESRQCPFCEGFHRLRIHGWYLRFALFLFTPPRRIAVRRLLCVVTGRTVSLLPDFCLPKRQHGPAILGNFLHAYIGGKTLLSALRKARGEASAHSVAQSLRDGFLRRAHEIRAYLAGLFSKGIEVPAKISKEKHRLASLVVGLLEGFSETDHAFLHHGYHFHRKFALGLA